jgi:hypothetical protein
MAACAWESLASASANDESSAEARWYSAMAASMSSRSFLFRRRSLPRR